MIKAEGGMFALASLVLGAVSATIIAFLHLKIADWTGYWLFGFTFFFVLPLGGAIFGFLGTLGVSLANTIREEAPLSNLFIGMIMGLFTWYMSYKLLAITIGFDSIWDGIFYLIQNADVTVMWREEHRRPDELELGSMPFLSWVSAIAQPFGAAFGGICAGALGDAAAKKPATS